MFDDGDKGPDGVLAWFACMFLIVSLAVAWGVIAQLK